MSFQHPHITSEKYNAYNTSTKYKWNNELIAIDR